MLLLPSRTNTLAIHGGLPIRSPRSSKWPIFDANEVDGLREFANKGEWWSPCVGTTGRIYRNYSPIVELQHQFASSHGCRYGVACSSGTAALILALKALEIGPGDSVIVPDYTWMATAQAVVLVGATPIFCDIEPETLNLNPATISVQQTAEARAIIAVHMLGLPCDIDGLKAHGLPIIEDACLAHGASYKGKFVGNLGEMAAFSFNAYKLIAAGEGGMVTTDCPSLAQVIEVYANNGQNENDKWWEASAVGYNFRMNQFAAVLCNAQLKKMEKFRQLRDHNVCELRTALADMPGIHIQPKYGDRKSSYYGLPLTYDRNIYEVEPERLAEILRAEGVDIATNYGKPLSHQGAFIQWKADNPVALQATKSTLFFPHAMLVADNDIGAIVRAFRKVYNLREQL